jgi:hypothetical protein
MRNSLSRRQWEIVLLVIYRREQQTDRAETRNQRKDRQEYIDRRLFQNEYLLPH